MQQDQDWIAHSPYARLLDERVRARLLTLKPVLVPQGTILFRPGDEPGGFVLVLSGRVGVFLTGKSGREILLYSVEAGETCVQTTVGLIGGRTYSGEAIAETDLVAVMIPPALFVELMAQSESFRSFVFNAFGERLGDVTRLLEMVAFVTVDQRLASALIERSRNGEKVELTHGELAAVIGSSREVVSRKLEKLKQNNIVRLERGAVEIVDRAALLRSLEQN